MKTKPNLSPASFRYQRLLNLLQLRSSGSMSAPGSKTQIPSSNSLVVIASVLCIILFGAHAAHATQLRVMTFNLWVGGVSGGQPLARTVEAIELAKADIVGLQETHTPQQAGVHVDNGQRIAEMLGWHYLDQGNRTGILSRFPIVESTPQKWGAKIQVAPGRDLYFFNAHFPASPYQPYQLLKIPYGNADFIETEAQAIEAADQARGDKLSHMLVELQAVMESGLPVVLTGDFNEPSHQDWTARAVAAKLCPLKVEFPTTRRTVEAGMLDAWRAVYPNEVTHPGRTWTPITSPTDPQDHHDRIDFVFVSRNAVKVVDAKRVGENNDCDLVLDPWPSDHRAVVVTVKLAK